LVGVEFVEGRVGELVGFFVDATTEFERVVEPMWEDNLDSEFLFFQGLSAFFLLLDWGGLGGNVVSV
jgi:hypothetical protein